jgi:hypothetical protein
MIKIEYIEDAIGNNTGWWILDYDKLDEEPHTRTGPYATKTQAIRMLRETEAVTINERKATTKRQPNDLSDEYADNEPGGGDYDEKF